jgi:hypothetical protein
MREERSEEDCPYPLLPLTPDHASKLTSEALLQVLLAGCFQCSYYHVCRCSPIGSHFALLRL